MERIEYNCSTGETKVIQVTPEEIAALPPLPQLVIDRVTMRQAQRALNEAGLLEAVESAIANMPGQDGVNARIDWKTSNNVERNNPLIAQLGTALNLTTAQIDDLFKLAASK